VFAELKAEVARLQRRYGDDGRYADPATRPKDDVDGGAATAAPLGRKTIPEAIAASQPQ